MICILLVSGCVQKTGDPVKEKKSNRPTVSSGNAYDVYELEFYLPTQFKRNKDNINTLYEFYTGKLKNKDSSELYVAITTKAIDENFTVYFTSKRIRIADQNPHVTYNTLELITGWVSSLLILDKKYRDAGLKEYLGHNLLYTIIGGIIASKVNKVKNYRKTLNNLIISIFSAKGIIIGFIYAIIMLCVSIIPYNISKYIYNKFA